MMMGIEQDAMQDLRSLSPTVAPTVQSSTSVKIEPTDKIIFGHPTIGKSYLKKQGEDKFITLDDDYADEVNAFVDANRGSETRQEYKGRKPKEYNEFMLNLYDRLKVQAQKEGKILFVSNTNILKERMSDFDKVITIPKVEFKKRFDERGSTYGFEDWKSEIDAAIAKVPANKVINTTGYLSDLLPTQPSTSVENIQPGLDLYKNALSKEEQKEFYDFGKSVIEKHGYNPFPQYVMASAGQIEWSPEMVVDKKGKLVNRGDNYNKKIISHKKNLKGTDGATGNRFTYHYYLSNLDGSNIVPIPSNIINSLEKATGQDMSDYDTVLINLYPIGRTLGWHVDVSEDYRNMDRDIISVSIGANADFYYANTPDDFISGDPEKSGYAVESKNLKSGDIIAFGGDSRLISHTVKNVSGKTDLGPIDLSNSNVNEFFKGGLSLDNWRMNFTFRVADPTNNKGKKEISTQSSTSVKPLSLAQMADTGLTEKQEGTTPPAAPKTLTLAQMADVNAKEPMGLFEKLEANDFEEYTRAGGTELSKKDFLSLSAQEQANAIYQAKNC
jgi:alkylated DNA repair dioxygenase AlkB